MIRLRTLGPALVVLFAAALLPLTVRAQFLHPKIVKKETTIRNVVVLPAKVEITRDSMKGPEGMAAESEAVSERVAKMVSDALAKKQVTTLDLPAPATGAGDPQEKYTIADFQARYDDLLPKIMKKRSDVKKARFTMGDEVLNLNLDKTADAIVFIRGKGEKETGGKTAMRLLVGGVPAYLMVNIGIVDARTGEVLLYTDGVITGDPTANENSLRNAITKALKKLPALPGIGVAAAEPTGGSTQTTGVISNYDKFRDETTISTTALISKPKDQRFEELGPFFSVSAAFVFSGQVKNMPPAVVSIGFIVKEFEGNKRILPPRFSTPTEFIVLYDGQRYKSTLTASRVRDQLGYVTDVVTDQIPLSTFISIVTSKTIEIRVGVNELRLTEGQVGALKELAKAAER